MEHRKLLITSMLKKCKNIFNMRKTRNSRWLILHHRKEFLCGKSVLIVIHVVPTQEVNNELM